MSQDIKLSIKEAIVKFKNREIQIHFDEKTMLHELQQIVGIRLRGDCNYYSEDDFGFCEFGNLTVVKISDITL